MSIPAFRVTGDDLPDADHKTLRAIGPLLEALNASLTNCINVVNALVLPKAKGGTFTTAANGAAYVDLGLGVPAQYVWAPFLTPTDGSVLDSVWSVSWTPQSSGARLLFEGLAPLLTYNFGALWL